MANIQFKGFQQVTQKYYNDLADSKKKGFLWLVRQFDETTNEPTSSAIYFGTRLYAESNYDSESNLVTLIDSLGLFDENGEFVGFHYTGSTTSDDHPILSLSAETLSDVLSNLESAILEKEDKLTKSTDITSASTENEIATAKAVYNAIKALKDEIDAKVAGLWHFKGTKDTKEDLPTDASEGDVYQVGEKEYAWNGLEWVELGLTLDLTNYVTSATTDALDTKITELSSATNTIETNLEELSGATETIGTNVETLSSATNALEEKTEALESKTTLSASTLDEAKELAKEDNKGQIIYITNDTNDTAYTEGAYIVVGDKELTRIGTTTETGDVASDVQELKDDMETLHTIGGDDVEDEVAETV